MRQGRATAAIDCALPRRVGWRVSVLPGALAIAGEVRHNPRRRLDNFWQVSFLHLRARSEPSHPQPERAHCATGNTPQLRRKSEVAASRTSLYSPCPRSLRRLTRSACLLSCFCRGGEATESADDSRVSASCAAEPAAYVCRERFGDRAIRGRRQDGQRCTKIASSSRGVCWGSPQPASAPAATRGTGPAPAASPHRHHPLHRRSRSRCSRPR